MITYKNIDDYIKSFSPDVQTVLQKIRQTIHKAEPNATETISYGLATFDLNKKHLVHFGAFKEHIGFYPTPSGTAKFVEQLKPYVTSKGSARFPLTKPVPYDLIAQITKFRAAEVTKK
ncbi:MAG TPA: DUF1801 domain-containing protein [Candidatus Saccharimonadales bacterium]|nr:DUF1801 domain-containing protein [Candidatus Saccharimonadales bacterium]